MGKTKTKRATTFKSPTHRGAVSNRFSLMQSPPHTKIAFETDHSNEELVIIKKIQELEADLAINMQCEVIKSDTPVVSITSEEVVAMDDISSSKIVSTSSLTPAVTNHASIDDHHQTPITYTTNKQAFASPNASRYHSYFKHQTEHNQQSPLSQAPAPRFDRKFLYSRRQPKSRKSLCQRVLSMMWGGDESDEMDDRGVWSMIDEDEEGRHQHSLLWHVATKTQQDENDRISALNDHVKALEAKLDAIMTKIESGHFNSTSAPIRISTTGIPPAPPLALLLAGSSSVPPPPSRPMIDLSGAKALRRAAPSAPKPAASTGPVGISLADIKAVKLRSKSAAPPHSHDLRPRPNPPQSGGIGALVTLDALKSIKLRKALPKDSTARSPPRPAFLARLSSNSAMCVPTLSDITNIKLRSSAITRSPGGTPHKLKTKNTAIGSPEEEKTMTPAAALRMRLWGTPKTASALKARQDKHNSEQKESDKEFENASHKNVSSPVYTKKAQSFTSPFKAKSPLKNITNMQRSTPSTPKLKKHNTTESVKNTQDQKEISNAMDECDRLLAQDFSFATA